MKFFSLIYQGDIHAATDEKIIPAEDYSILVEASQILEKALEDAVSYKKKTEEECEKLREIAKQEGFDEGLKQFNEHLITFEIALKQLRHELNKLVLPLALKAAKKIVGRELELHPEAIVDIVLQAIAPATQNRYITIYVNKADKEILEAHKPRIKEILEQVSSLSIKERHDVSPGGCIIETETGIINAGIENQWRALEAAFDRYMKR
jgi:type III secretion protein L